MFGLMDEYISGQMVGQIDRWIMNEYMECLSYLLRLNTIPKTTAAYMDNEPKCSYDA